MGLSGAPHSTLLKLKGGANSERPGPVSKKKKKNIDPVGNTEEERDKADLGTGRPGELTKTSQKKTLAPA